MGGAVRDELLGIPVKDRDWVVVGATPEQMLEKGFRQVGADFPVFLHPETHEEYALARTERKQGHGYHGFTVYSAPDVTLEDDLRRRDLTINAMARANDGHIVDPFHGHKDLENRQLRHVSEAFAEDPLRILRTARFTARFHHRGFQVAAETMDLMKQMVGEGEVRHLVPERVWQEIQRALLEPSPTAFFDVLREAGALHDLIPELEDPSAFDRSMQALTCCLDQGVGIDGRFAALLSPRSPDQVVERATALKAPNDCRDLARLTVEIAPKLTGPGPLTAETVLAVMEQADTWRRPDRFLRLLDTLACLPHGPTDETLATIRNAIDQVRAVDARALMAQGFKGKELGEAIRRQRLDILKNCLRPDTPRYQKVRIG